MGTRDSTTESTSSPPSTIAGIVTVAHSIPSLSLSKGKSRPIGYKTSGGYVKTTKGWVKASIGKQQSKDFDQRFATLTKKDAEYRGGANDEAASEDWAMAAINHRTLETGIRKPARGEKAYGLSPKALPADVRSAISKFFFEDASPRKDKKLNKKLDAAVELSPPIKKDMVSYRGMVLPEKELKKFEEGKTVTSKVVTAYTNKPAVAWSFATKATGGHRSYLRGSPVVIRTLIPKGTKVARLNIGLGTGAEHLVHSGASIKIHKVRKLKSRTVIDCEIVASKLTKAQLLKGKPRPVGYRTPGGYIKTAKGWRKVSGGTKEVKPERREKEEPQSGKQPSEVFTDYRSIAKLSTAELKKYVKEKFTISIFAGITKKNRDGGNLIVLQLGILHQLGFVNRKRLQIKIVDGILNLDDKGWETLAQYQPRHHRILVGKKYTSSFVHEYFHHLFYTKGLSKTKAVRKLLDAIEGTHTYARYGEMDRRRGKLYYQNDTEMLSRLAESSVHTLLPSELRSHVSPRDYNDTLFSSAEVEKLKPLFVRAFRKGPAILKSLCFLLEEDMKEKVVLFKAKARPIGFKTAGGYVKTAKGWRKVASGSSVGGAKRKKETSESKKVSTKVIPAAALSKPIREETYKVISRGRDYFTVLTPKGYKAKLLITDESNHFQVDGKYTVKVRVHTTEGGGFLTTRIYPVSKVEEAEQQKQQHEAEQKRRAVETYVPDGLYWNGKVYGNEQYGFRIYVDNEEKRITQAQRNYLVNHVTDVRAKMQASPKGKEESAKKIEANIERYLGYMKEAAGEGRIYKNGLSKLKEWDVDQFPEYKKKLDAILQEAEENRQQMQKDKEKSTMKEMGNAIGKHFLPTNSVPMDKPLKSGNKIIVYTGSKGKRWFSAEDAPSFGLGFEGTYASDYYYREATDAEKVQFEKEQKALQHQKEKQLKFRSDLSGLEKQIKEAGEIPRGEDQIFIGGKRYFDTQDVYGGGSWFEVTKDSIWYVQNNGMDGDNWAYNNVRTGGAGAIGWKIPYSKKIVNQLEKLVVEKQEIEKFEEQKYTKSMRIRPMVAFLLKGGPLRPIGFKTVGGYIKTAKGWRKASKLAIREAAAPKRRESEPSKIPEEAMSRPTFLKTYKITAKGKKYFTVPTGQGYDAKLLITPQTSDFEVGKTYTLPVKVHRTTSGGFTTTKVYPVEMKDVEKTPFNTTKEEWEKYKKERKKK